MANCWVKFVCPFTSVIVPAANNNSVLKWRPFTGNSFTFWLESFSLPVPLAGFEVVLGFPFETPAAGVWGLFSIGSAVRRDILRPDASPIPPAPAGNVGDLPHGGAAGV